MQKFVFFLIFVGMFIGCIGGLALLGEAGGIKGSSSASTSGSKPSTPGVYYLWYKGQSYEKVAIMGPSHQSVPVDGNQLANWFLSGTACVADADTKAYRGNSKAPFGGVAIEVAEGTCRGFIGWVPMEAFQTSRSW